MKQKRSRRFWVTTAGAVPLTIAALSLYWENGQLKIEARTRENYFVSLHFVIQDEFISQEEPPADLSQVQPYFRDFLVKPFHGNIALRKTGEDAFVLEEPEERWVSLFRKDRLFGDENGMHWQRSGAPLVKR